MSGRALEYVVIFLDAASALGLFGELRASAASASYSAASASALSRNGPPISRNDAAYRRYSSTFFNRSDT